MPLFLRVGTGCGLRAGLWFLVDGECCMVPGLWGLGRGVEGLGFRVEGSGVCQVFVRRHSVWLARGRDEAAVEGHAVVRHGPARHWQPPGCFHLIRGCSLGCRVCGTVVQGLGAGVKGSGMPLATPRLLLPGAGFRVCGIVV